MRQCYDCLRLNSFAARPTKRGESDMQRSCTRVAAQFRLFHGAGRPIVGCGRS